MTRHLSNTDLEDKDKKLSSNIITQSLACRMKEAEIVIQVKVSKASKQVPSGAASPVKYPVVASIARLLLGLPSKTKS